MKSPLLMLGLSGKIYYVLSSLEDALARQYNDKLLARIKEDSSAKFTSAIDLVNHIVTFDPTGKSYKRWLIVTYLNKGIAKVEDLYKAKDALVLFDKYKSKIANKDINSYKSLQDLFNVTDPFDTNSKNFDKDSISDKETETLFYKNEQAILIHDSSRFKIVQPKTREASRFFGRNTKWCTSARDNSSNQFDRYKSHFNLFYILDKANNKRWAIASPIKSTSQEQTQSFDEQDKSVPTIDVLDIAPEIKSALLPMLNISFLYENGFPIVGKNKQDLDVIQAKLHSQIMKGDYSGIKNNLINMSDLEHVVDLVTNGKINDSTVNDLCKNKSLTPDMIKRLMKLNLRDKALVGLASNPKTSSENLERLSCVSSDSMFEALVENKNTNAKSLGHILSSTKSFDIIYAALCHKNIPKDILEKHLKKPVLDNFNTVKILSNENTPYALAKKYCLAYKNCRDLGIIALTDHPEFKLVDLKPLINKLSMSEKVSLISYSYQTIILEVLLEDKVVEIRRRAAESLIKGINNGEVKLEKYIDTIINDSSRIVQYTIFSVDKKHLVPEMFTKLLNHSLDSMKIKTIETYYKVIPKPEVEKLFYRTKSTEVKQACLYLDGWTSEELNDFFAKENDIVVLGDILVLDVSISADVVIKKLPLLIKNSLYLLNILHELPKSFRNKNVIEYIYNNTKDKDIRNKLTNSYRKYLPNSAPIPKGNVTLQKEKRNRS